MGPKPKSHEKYILDCIDKHGDKYDISKIVYTNSRCKVTPICKIHGEWNTRADRFLVCGCKKCSQEASNTKTRTHDNDFIDRCKVKHGDRYLLDKIEYKGTRSRIVVICRKHGEWSPLAGSFISGKGCPKCRSSKREIFIEEYLKSKNIDFTREKRFHSCRDKLPLPFDFYLPSKNICIEYDGEQHFYKSNIWFGTDSEEQLSKVRRRDNIKTKYCNDNNIVLYRIKFTMSDADIVVFLDNVLCDTV